MSTNTIKITNGPIFNGHQLLHNHSAIFADGRCSAVMPTNEAPETNSVIDLKGDIFSLGFADLQVNGGGGVLLNDDPSVATLQIIADAHRSLGTSLFLPTLITSTPELTKAAIDAAIQAVESGMAGVAGLHLEGPHLSIQKKGAHNAALVRSMQQSDLELLLYAASKLPVLKITIAPESVSVEQVKALNAAGVLLALGHTDASCKDCLAYYKAGASCATHLFNAMSQLGSREPGLVGAALDTNGFSMGLIADGVHVHATTVRVALKSMGGMDRVYLVSDAMAVAGTAANTFKLDGRTIHRRDGRLTLDDGTLAGADLELTSAIRFIVNEVGEDLQSALQSAVTVPRKLLGMKDSDVSLIGTDLVGTDLADTIRISSTLDGLVSID